MPSLTGPDESDLIPTSANRPRIYGCSTRSESPSSPEDPDQIAINILSMNAAQGSVIDFEQISNRLIAIWVEVLGVPVDADDDFFALGGESISATHVMHMASESFGIELPMILIVTHSTVSELATEIERILKKIAA